MHRRDAQAAPRRRQELADCMQRHHARRGHQGARPERGAPVVRRLRGCYVQRNGGDQPDQRRSGTR
eukprot:scaffold57793_cov36-Phaeocystis_antarctica.AAC.1